MFDDTSLSSSEFLSSLEKFKVDEVSIDEVEDDICFNAKDVFEKYLLVNLIGLKYTEDESTKERVHCLIEKRKRGVYFGYAIVK